MLGEALRLIRVFHDMKLSALAKELQVSKGYLSEIESSKKQPKMDLIEKYSQFFSIPSSTILFFSEELDKDKEFFEVRFRNKILKFLQVVEDVTIKKNDKKSK